MDLNRSAIFQQAYKLGFHKAGIAAVPEEPNSDEKVATARIKSWLNQGYQADMAWMANIKRQNIRRIMPEVRSIICVAINYYTEEKHADRPEYGKISRYGWGRDYHRILSRKLKTLTRWLEEQVPTAQVRYYADTGPVQDKFWAQQAGLGWIAKNGNLITREYGSWVFLGEILTNIELPGDPPHTSHCGTCTRCLEACPTEAIRSPGVVDANRCIAYHTIENRAPELPTDIAANLQGWVAGCDICQDVCPWNQRFAQPTDIDSFHPYPQNQTPLLSDLADLTEAEWNQRFQASAIRRIKPYMWRRNARAAQASHYGQR